MTPKLLALIVAFLAAPQQTSDLPHAFPMSAAKQVIDNERVTVWDVTWEKGEPTPRYQLKYDAVVIDLVAMTVRPSNFRTTAVMTSFLPKGTSGSDEGASNTPRHAFFVDLKDVKVPLLPNKSGFPDAFPREGAKKLLDNNRVTVWDFSWTPGKPTAMHFHGKDVVAVYLGNGDLSSTTPDGKTVVNSSSFGQAKFNPRDRTHYETLVKGSQRVIAVELK